MSPQRRKGRGGGSGKVVALPPQLDSPPSLLPHQKNLKGLHCKSSLATVVSASRQPSITPISSHSTTISARAKLKEKYHTVRASSASSRHPLLSAAALCGAVDSAKCKSITSTQASSRSNGVSKSRKCSTNSDRQKNSHARPLVGQARTRTGSGDIKHSKKSSKVSVLSSHIEKSHNRSQSCRISLQNEDLGECLRWSLPSQSKRIDDVAAEKALSAKQRVSMLPEKCASPKQRELMDVPFYEPSTGRRFSFGSSVMSMVTSCQSADEDVFVKDDFTGVADKFTDDIGIRSDEVYQQWSKSTGAEAHKPSRDSVELEENMEANPCDFFKGSVKLNSQNTLSSTENEEHAKPASQLLSNIHSVLPNAAIAFAFCGQQVADSIPNFSNSLQQRLALLEGRVSHIASELRKTKELLDSNSSSSSAALLSDIHGKILSIEQAMTVNISNCGKTLPEDPLMEADLRSTMESQTSDALSHGDPLMFLNTKYDESAKTCFIREPCLENAPEFVFTLTSHKSDKFKDDQQDDVQERVESQLGDAPYVRGDTEMYFRMKHGASSISTKSSVIKWCHQDPPCHASSLTSRKFDMLEVGQEELEDRLFPHRKLLKNLKSLHDRVTESRAALHSKLENGLPQVFDATGNAMTLSAEMLKSSDMNGLNDTKEFTKADPSTALEINHGLNYGNICNENAANSVAMPCASGQAIPSIQATGSQDLVPAENFFKCDESFLFESSTIHENLEPGHELELESDEDPALQLQSIGKRVTTAGWYACDGEAIVLVHDDGCCSFHDVANMEEKALYECPEGTPAIPWNDCWLIRAAGTDGRANKYIVAATSGSVLDAGFCSWDFHSRDVAAYHIEDDFTWLDLDESSHVSPSATSPKLSGVTCLHGTSSINANAGLSPNGLLCPSMSSRTSQRWYKPCGPLIASAGSFLKHVLLYDIRDGELVMMLETKQPISSLNISSPLQWRNRGKLALAEEQAISIWDVNTLDGQCLNYIQLLGKQICAFQMHNADAEYSGGVRQRLSSSDMEAFDGICCTQGDINILDLRIPNGIGLCLPIIGQNVQSVFSRGDMMITGGLSRASNKCEMQQWSVRKGRPVCTYAFRPSQSHHMHLLLRQVWGSSSSAMAVNGNGLHLFQGYKETTDEHYVLLEHENTGNAQDLLNPSFDYANSQILLISGDRPASWCYWPW